MSVPVRWPGKTFFYPVGNTPAINLTQSLPPEGDANLLLLGCGDPRSILYTLFGESNRARKLDFTCCDVEPAVLARNIILLTLIIDGHPVDRIWNVFYHYNLDDASLALLVDQCNTLLSVSSDLHAWSNSPYHPIIKFSTSHTLAQLRRHWELYVNFPKLPRAKHKAFREALRKMLDARMNEVYHSAALAGGMAALDAMIVTQENFKTYRKTGVVHPIPSVQTAAKHINPTFVYSILGDACVFHYGTYPVSSFHVGEAFSTKVSVTQKELVDCIIAQFKRWCGAWKDSLAKTVVRFAVGDAVDFSRTLWNLALTGSKSASLFVSPWAGAELVLDGGEMPTSFDVIDTSNLMDFTGVLNVLIATAPLLTPSPFATLKTETLVGVGKDPIQGFVKRLCADIPTFACMLGIAPIGYLSGFHTESNVHEIIVSRSDSLILSRPGQIRHQKGYHERISWKLLPPVFPSIEPQSLARLLYNTYIKIFGPYEDLSVLMDMERIADLGSAAFPTVLNYHRHTFIVLLFFLKGRFHIHGGDWNLAMSTFLGLLVNNRELNFGTNFFQEICILMHTHGIYSSPLIEPDPYLHSTVNIFAGWGNSLPTAVCLVLVFPKTAPGMQELFRMQPNELGTAMFEISILSDEGLNMYSAIQIVFGKARAIGEGLQKRVEIEEDEGGWASSAPDASVIVSAWIPSLTLSLIQRPWTAKVRFNIHHTAGTVLHGFNDKFGVDLVVHEEDLLNINSVHVLTSRSGLPRELEVLAASAPKSPPEVPRMAVIKLDEKCTRVKDMTVREMIIDERELEVLQAGTKVEVVHTTGLCNAMAEFGEYSKLFTFPLPVDSVSARLRIARKSGYLELVSPPIVPGASRQVVYVTLAPVLHNLTPVSWNLHYVNLDCCPTFKQGKKRRADLCQMHCSLALSDREKAIRERGINTGLVGAPETLPVLNVKDTILALFTKASQVEDFKYRIFSLSDDKRGGIYASILVNRLCLDLPSHGIILDCNVIFYERETVVELAPVLQNPDDQKDTAQIAVMTSGDETLAWLHLLPAFVERCRTWSHNPNCEYRTLGRIPVSSEYGKFPLCRCGSGQNLGCFFDKGKMAKLKPHATRAAISPLYAVSYLDIVGNGLTDGTSKPKAPDPHGCAKCGAKAKEKKSLSLCTRCRKAMYCGAECQRADWDTHKHFCKENSK